MDDNSKVIKTNNNNNNNKINIKYSNRVFQWEVYKNLILKKENFLKERFIVKLPLSSIKNGKKIIHVKVLGNGKEIETVKTKFIGPSL